VSVILDYLNGILKLHQNLRGERMVPAEAYYEWLLKNGKLFTEKEDAEKYHQEFKKVFKGCYFNAQVMALDNKELTYYEGWGITEKVGIPLEHAFNAVDGKVVDITWVDGIEYFGVEVPVMFVTGAFLKVERAHPVLFQWWEEVEGRKHEMQKV